MSLPVPLTVRLQTARGGRVVTAEARDLWFRSVIPGGFAAVSVALARPLTIRPDEVDYYGRLLVHDARTGATVCEGRLEDPGRSAGRDGQVWSLTAIGPSAHPRDRTVPLVYVDRQLSGWARIPSTLQEVDTNSDRPDSASDPGWRIQVRQGSTISSARGQQLAGGMGGVEYWPITDSGQRLARLSLAYDMGNSDGNWRLRVTVDPDVGAATVVGDVGWSTAGGTLAKVIGTDWPAGSINRPRLMASRINTNVTVTDDTTYQMLSSIVVQATRYSAAGVELTSGSSYPLDTVRASEVVADLLGRLLNQYDGATASIATTTHPIDQLAYPDGVTAEQVLADLMAVEVDHYWAAWESNMAGRYRFEWRPWPTSVRYEADVVDGYDSTGSADGLYDAVRVRYRTPEGRIVNVRRTQTVPALAAAGITREALLDLGDEVGSLTNAQRAGDQFLAEHAAPPNAGRLVVARPILDRAAGRMVMPWEIRPGNLIRARGILPRPDGLNATSRDGVTVFRIIGAEFRASDGAAVLELDSLAPTLPRLLSQDGASTDPVRPRRR